MSSEVIELVRMVDQCLPEIGIQYNTEKKVYFNKDNAAMVSFRKITGLPNITCHFEDVQDLKVFLTISPEVQRQRVLNRPAFLHDRFFREWIPMEERYFTGFRIPEKCDLVF